MAKTRKPYTLSDYFQDYKLVGTIDLYLTSKHPRETSAITLDVILYDPSLGLFSGEIETIRGKNAICGDVTASDSQGALIKFMHAVEPLPTDSKFIAQQIGYNGNLSRANDDIVLHGWYNLMPSRILKSFEFKLYSVSRQKDSQKGCKEALRLVFPQGE